MIHLTHQSATPKSLQAEIGATVDPLLPVILVRAFKGELNPGEHP